MLLVGKGLCLLEGRRHGSTATQVRKRRRATHLVIGRMLWLCPPFVMGRLRDVPGRGASAVALSSMRISAAPLDTWHVNVVYREKRRRITIAAVVPPKTHCFSDAATCYEDSNSTLTKRNGEKGVTTIKKEPTSLKYGCGGTTRCSLRVVLDHTPSWQGREKPAGLRVATANGDSSWGEIRKRIENASHLLFHFGVVQVLFQRQSTALEVPDGLREQPPT